MVDATVNGGSSEDKSSPRPPTDVPTRGFAHALEQAKLAALAEFAAGAGHEINNPLGSILIASEKLLRDESNPERRRLLATIGGQALRIRDMIGDLMLFANPPPPALADLELAAEVRSVAARFNENLSARDIHLQLAAATEVPIHADPVQLAVVISELLRNAIDAVPDGGRISIAANAVRDEHLQWALLTVADNGRGLSETERAHLFDPFFSGRQAGRGLGFGLCKVWRIVTHHGGQIRVSSPDEGGTEMTVRWPASSE
jgi:signal transduction histidine kinase